MVDARRSDFVHLCRTAQVHLRRKQNDTWINKADDLQQDVDKHDTISEYEQYTNGCRTNILQYRTNTISSISMIYHIFHFYLMTTGSDDCVGNFIINPSST